MNFSEAYDLEGGRSDPSKLYLGRMCGKKHTGLRWKNSSACVACMRERGRTYNKDWRRRRIAEDGEYREKVARYQQDYYRSHVKTVVKPVVYLVYSPELDLYKIGFTRNLQRRLPSIRVGNPNIRLVASFSGTQCLESTLHKALASYRVKGEWFHLQSIQQVLDLLPDDCKAQPAEEICDVAVL